MKEKELREKATCGICGQKIGHTGMPIFYTVKFQTWGLDHGALQRQTGLEMMLGGHVALAQIMGADEDMANPMSKETEVTICFECWTESTLPLCLVAGDKD